MSMPRLVRAPCMAWLVLACACPTEGGSAARTPAPLPAPAPAPAASPAEPAAAPVREPDAPLGRVRPDAPLPIASILGAEPQLAQTHLGDPVSKGGTKKTCVRFVPDRVFFECAFAWQRYADRTGMFGAIEVRYEDGRAASIAFEQLPGEGEFDPRGALVKVGLDLPGEPQVSQPAPNVELWSWFNAAARLRVHDRQYRVEVSAVDGEWAKAKVDIILNHPLTDAQKAAIVQPVSQAGDAG
jgi:hypothetical protein